MSTWIFSSSITRPRRPRLKWYRPMSSVLKGEVNRTVPEFDASPSSSDWSEPWSSLDGTSWEECPTSTESISWVYAVGKILYCEFMWWVTGYMQWVSRYILWGVKTFISWVYAVGKHVYIVGLCGEEPGICSGYQGIYCEGSKRLYRGYIKWVSTYILCISMCIYCEYISWGTNFILWVYVVGNRVYLVGTMLYIVGIRYISWVPYHMIPSQGPVTRVYLVGTMLYLVGNTFLKTYTYTPRGCIKSSWDFFQMQFEWRCLPGLDIIRNLWNCVSISLYFSHPVLSPYFPTSFDPISHLPFLP